MTDPCLILELTRRYCEPHRHYHTIEHIAAMLFSGRDLELTDAQIHAVWFHDAVYDPRSDTNEADSAALATTMLRAQGWDQAHLDSVASMVLDTKNHVPTSAPSKLVIDLDLSSLAAPWEEYERNGANIRREYDWVSESEFRAGTRVLLQSFLDRERIYLTAWGSRLEERARANMRRAIEILA